jgi:hypothetical protein
MWWCSHAAQHPELVPRAGTGEEIVAAAAIVAACLPGGESIRQELAYWRYEADAILPGGPILN